MIRFLLFFVIISFSLTAGAQGSLSSDDRKAVKLYEKADKSYRERDFTTAIEWLQEAKRRDPDFFEVYARLGSLYNAMGQMDSVYSNFSKYAEIAPDPVASVLERLAGMALDRGAYEKSALFLSSFLKKVPEKAQDPEIQLLQKKLKFAASQLSAQVDSVYLKPLPPAINRFKLQYLPALTIDQQTIFFTKRDRVQGDEDIVVSEKQNEHWMPARAVSQNINTSLNEGACTVSADGRTMIFASCDRRDSFGSCDLFISTKAEGKWSKPRNLGGKVNSKYWESQPSLSADGKTLYFSSNRPGGFGSRDIWVSTFESGVWQPPVNLGAVINSRKDETTPFIHFNGSTLFFSANGYEGMGGYDLYYSSLADSTWHPPVNLGYPINSYKDEVAIVVSADSQKGMYAKEQQKNRQILESTIVEFVVPDKLKPPMASYLVGKILDASTGVPLRAEIEVNNLKTNQVIYQSESEPGTGEYYMVLPVGLDLAAYVKKKGYLFQDFSFQTAVNSVLRPDTIEIRLQPISEGSTIVLQNIYFETDSYELDPRSTSELNNVLQILQQNPKIVVRIDGHTDSSGSSSYNQDLSEKRAYTVYKTLKAKGIPAKRLSYKGFADAKPIDTNETESGREANRRIEFRVLRLN